MRHIIVALSLICSIQLQGQQMDWSRLAEDTIYYAKEYLPTNVRITSPGPAQIWDLRSLRAPYAISRRILVTGERGNGATGQLLNGKQPDAILSLNGSSSSITQIIEDNPVCASRRLTYHVVPAKKPFFHHVMGGTYNYNGKMQAVFSWPRDINCAWSPLELPDSCRITYFIVENTIVDGEGTLYLPTEVHSVYRQKISEKRTLKIEAKTGNFWRDVTTQVPGIQLVSYKEHIVFTSSDSGLPLADIELKDEETIARIQFKTHPLVTRIMAEEPSKPDIFAYPNPSFDVVRFQLSDLSYGKYKLKIFNILGVPVMETEVEVKEDRKTVSLDLRDLQRGTYLYRLQDGFGRTIKTKRVVLIQP